MMDIRINNWSSRFIMCAPCDYKISHCTTHMQNSKVLWLTQFAKFATFDTQQVAQNQKLCSQPPSAVFCAGICIECDTTTTIALLLAAGGHFLFGHWHWPLLTSALSRSNKTLRLSSWDLFIQAAHFIALHKKLAYLQVAFVCIW